MPSNKSLMALDVGLSKPILDSSLVDLMRRGEILAFQPTEPNRNRPTVTATRRHNTCRPPDGIVYSKEMNRLYYTNMSVPALNDGSIYSTRPDGSDTRVVLSKGQIHTPKQLALNDVGEELYICDREGLRVIKCNLDGSGLETLMETGTATIRPGSRSNTLKGSSKSGTGRVFCAPIESSVSKDGISLLQNLPEPIDLDMNESTSMLHWTDHGEFPYGNSFDRVELDESGSGIDLNTFKPTPGMQHEVLVQNFNEAIGLCHDDETKRQYIADMGGTIWSFEEEGRDKGVFFRDGNRSFTGIALASSD